MRRRAPTTGEGAAHDEVRRADIDGLRGIAITLVVIYHAAPRAAPGGYVGVDLFFVISGFLITGIIFHERESGRFSFPGFYRRRVLRLFPALVTVLAVCLAIGWFVLPPADLARLGRETIAGGLFVPNLLFWRSSGYFAVATSTQTLIHLWSLGIEEQFYLAWPLLIFALGRRRRVLLVVLAGLTLGSLAYCARMAAVDPNAAFFSPLARLWELSLGGLLAIHLQQRAAPAPDRPATRLAPVAALGLLALAVTMHSGRQAQGLLLLLPTSAALLLIWAGPGAWVNQRILSQRTVVWVGLISYPLYLWHWPLLSFAQVQVGGTPALATRLSIVAGSVGLAWVTYHFFEQPVRRHRTRPWIVVALAFAMVAVVGCGFQFNRADGYPGRYSGPIAHVIDDIGLGNRNSGVAGCFAPPGREVDLSQTQCTPSRAGHPEVWVWGDSHAAALSTGLRLALPKADDIGQVTQADSAPLIGATFGSCLDSNRAILQRMKQVRPGTVILFARWAQYSIDGWQPGGRWARGLAETLAAVRAAGVSDVVVVGPAPDWGNDLPTVLLQAWTNSRPRRVPVRLVPAEDQIVRSVDTAMARQATGAGVRFVSLVGLMCDADGCLTHAGSIHADLFAHDYGHLTDAGAVWVTRRLVERHVLR